MADQKDHWNKIHQEGAMDSLRAKPSEYVRSIADRIAPRSAVLELGCGTGGDASFLANLGHKVTATDFSGAVIAENIRYYKNLDFRVVDISQPLPFAANSFDVVFANLSLHYFDDETTERVFSEIYRVLRKGGTLLFRCKSIYSQSEKVGAEEIAPNIYICKMSICGICFQLILSTSYLIRQVLRPLKTGTSKEMCMASKPIL